MGFCACLAASGQIVHNVLYNCLTAGRKLRDRLPSTLKGKVAKRESCCHETGLLAANQAQARRLGILIASDPPKQMKG